MAENVYEGMFLLDSTRFGREPDAVSEQIPKMIQEAGGQLLVSRLWEERRLAYPINGQRKGTYWLTYFRIDGKKLSGLHRTCQLSDSILRELFLKIDGRIVDTLVEHAKAGPVKPEPRSGPVRPVPKPVPKPVPAEGKPAEVATEAAPAEAAPAEVAPAENGDSVEKTDESK